MPRLHLLTDALLPVARRALVDTKQQAPAAPKPPAEKKELKVIHPLRGAGAVLAALVCVSRCFVVGLARVMLAASHAMVWFDETPGSSASLDGLGCPFQRWSDCLVLC
jgi:hypothetical protein